jgi:hypothetical protein
MTDIAVMLTPAQVAQRLGVSVKFVYQLCETPVEIVDGVRIELDPELGHNRFGRRIGIPETEVDAYLARTFVSAKTDEHRHRSRQAA